MSIDLSGCSEAVTPATVSIAIPANHPLIKLAGAFRTKFSRVCKRRQRLLECGQSSRASEARYQREWPSASSQHQKQDRVTEPRKSRQTHGPPSWHRGINRSNKTRRPVKSKQNEKRHCYISGRVLVCPRIQFEAAEPGARSRNKQRGVISKCNGVPIHGKKSVRSGNAMGSTARSIATLWIVSGA